MKPYERETLAAIRSYTREHVEKLSCMLMNSASDEVLSELWRGWSSEVYCAKWIEHVGKVESFCEWATTAPCDRKEME